jgi:type II secretory pathway component GspD/PulD (secretin)
MSRPVLFLAVSVVLHAAAAAPAEDAQRLVYPVRNGSANDLAAAIGKEIKGVEAFAEPSSNCVLLSGRPDLVAEAARALERLDRRPRLLAVEVVVVGLSGDKEPNVKDFAGPVADVTARLAELQKKEKGVTVTRLQATGADNQPCRALLGESRPYVVSVGQPLVPGGPAPTRIQFRDVGTQVSLTPQLTQDGTVVVELELKAARLHVAPEARVLGKNDKGEEIRETEFVTATANGKVAVAPGQVVPVKDVQVKSTSGSFKAVVLVTARALDEPGPSK